MRQFHKPELVISAASSKQWPSSSLPEVILAGKSNVGKSSFINGLVGRKSLAYVGQTPGKTRLLNFYNLDDKLMLVDAPGYGYAKRSKSEAIDYGKLMEEYFSKRDTTKCCVLLLDIRHLPSDNDLVMLDFLRYNQIPYFVVLTKADKLSYSKQIAMKNEIRKALDISIEDIYTFSAVKKDNLEEIWDKLDSYLEN